MKVCVLLGPPGAGKGTQAGLLSSRLGAAHISTGLLIRQEIASGSPLGIQVKALVESGKLVDDDTLFACLASGLGRVDTSVRVLLLDGVPRTVSQVQKLDEVLKAMKLKVDIGIAVSAPVEKLVERFAMRWTCASCGAVASYAQESVATAATCTQCHKVGMFKRRPDDAPESVRTRFAVYEKETAPLMEIFEKRGLLTVVDGLQPAEYVYVEVASRLLST